MRERGGIDINALSAGEPITATKPRAPDFPRARAGAR